MENEMNQAPQQENIPETSQPEAQATQKESTDLNIQDLVGLKSVVDVATQRGAFKAAELEAVGKLYNRLDKFINSVSTKES